MKNNKRHIAICPKCGKAYAEHPALSREDNTTLICPDCGVLEALSSLGIDKAEQQQILRTIHNCRQGGENDE